MGLEHLKLILNMMSIILTQIIEYAVFKSLLLKLNFSLTSALVVLALGHVEILALPSEVGPHHLHWKIEAQPLHQQKSLKCASLNVEECFPSHYVIITPTKPNKFLNTI